MAKKAATAKPKQPRQKRSGNYVLQRYTEVMSEPRTFEWRDLSNNHEGTTAAKKAITEPGEYRVIVETWRKRVTKKVTESLVFVDDADADFQEEVERAAHEHGVD